MNIYIPKFAIDFFKVINIEIFTKELKTHIVVIN